MQVQWDDDHVGAVGDVARLQNIARCLLIYWPRTASFEVWVISELGVIRPVCWTYQNDQESSHVS